MKVEELFDFLKTSYSWKHLYLLAGGDKAEGRDKFYSETRVEREVESVKLMYKEFYFAVGRHSMLILAFPPIYYISFVFLQFVVIAPGDVHKKRLFSLVAEEELPFLLSFEVGGSSVFIEIAILIGI